MILRVCSKSSKIDSNYKTTIKFNSVQFNGYLLTRRLNDPSAILKRAQKNRENTNAVQIKNNNKQNKKW